MSIFKQLLLAAFEGLFMGIGFVVSIWLISILM